MSKLSTVSSPHQLDRYVVSGECFWIKAENPKDIPIQLATFTASIIEDRTVDDINGIARSFLVSARVAGTESEFELTSGEFEAMGWLLEKVGPAARLRPMHLAKEKLRDAILWNSKTVRSVLVLRKLGWTTVGTSRIYVHAGGAILKQCFLTSRTANCIVHILPTSLLFTTVLGRPTTEILRENMRIS